MRKHLGILEKFEKDLQEFHETHVEDSTLMPQKTEERVKKIEKQFERYAEKKKVENNKVEWLKKKSSNPFVKLITGNKNICKLLANNPQNSKYISYGYTGETELADRYSRYFGVVYDVYSVDGEIKFTLKGIESRIRNNYQIVIYEGTHKIGVLKEHIALRAPVIREDNPHNFSFTIDGEKVGGLRTTNNFLRADNKAKVIFDGQEWMALFTGDEFKIVDGYGNRLLTISWVSALLLNQTDAYVIDYPPQVNQKLIMFAFAAYLAMYNTTKMDWREKARWYEMHGGDSWDDGAD